MARSLGGLRIIRQRFWYIHPSPAVRNVTNEYTLLNESDQIVHDVFLADLPLMLGLEVFNEEERRLAFLPNQQVRSIVQPLLEEKSHPSHARIQEIMLPGPPYFLWIKLGISDRIEPGEAKIIRLKYIEKEEPKTPSITVTPFSLERHKVVCRRSANEDYDIFVQITAPAGYKLNFDAKAISEANNLTEREGFYVNRTDEFAQIRIPSRNAEVTCSIYYDISPPKSERRFFEGMLIALYIISSFLLFLVILKDWPEAYRSLNEAFYYSAFQPLSLPDLNTIFKGVFEKLFEIVAGIVALSVAIVGFIRDPLFGRARWFYLGTAALSIAAFIIGS